MSSQEATVVDRKESLQGAKLALLQQRLKKGFSSAHANFAESFTVPDITRQEDKNKPFSLTDAQRSALGGFYYHEIRTNRTDIANLMDLWLRVTAMHPMTRIRLFGGINQQAIIATSDTASMVFRDLSDDDLDDAEAWLDDSRARLTQRLTTAEIETQWTKWRPWRMSVAHLPDGDSAVQIRMERAAVDGPSIHLLLLQWSKLASNREIIEPPIDYHDYACMWPQFKQHTIYQAAQNYWENRGSSRQPLLKVNRPTSREGEIRRLQYRINAKEWSAQLEQGRLLSVSPSTYLLLRLVQTLQSVFDQSTFSFDATLFNRLSAHKSIYDVAGPFASAGRVDIPIQNHDDKDTEKSRMASLLQQQLAEIVEHWYPCAGINVQQTRAEGSEGLRTVKFTSSLAAFAQGEIGEAHAAAVGENPLAWLGETTHSFAYSPDTWLEVQLLEEHDAVVLTWDVLPHIISTTDLDAMWSMYLGTLSLP